MFSPRRIFFIYFKRILWNREGILEHWLGYVISLKLFLEVVILVNGSKSWKRLQILIKSIHFSKQKMQNICNFGEIHISPNSARRFPLSFPFFIN